MHLLLSLHAGAIGGTQQRSPGNNSATSFKFAEYLSRNGYNSDPAEHIVLKKKFVAHFAELLSREDGAFFVSSDLLFEQYGAATIVAARNAGFEPMDVTFRDNLLASMSRMSVLASVSVYFQDRYRKLIDVELYRERGEVFATSIA